MRSFKKSYRNTKNIRKKSRKKKRIVRKTRKRKQIGRGRSLLNRIRIPKAKKIRNTFRRFSRSSRNEPIYASNKLIKNKQEIQKKLEKEKRLHPKKHRSCTGIYNGRAVYILENANERKRKHVWMIETNGSTEKISRNLIEGCDIDNSNAERSVFNINNQSINGKRESLVLHNNMYAKLKFPTGNFNTIRRGSNGSNKTTYATLNPIATQAMRNAQSETFA